jgi:AcrR family transcriptional regulator
MTASKGTPASTRRRGRPALNRTTPLERAEILDRALAIVQKEGRDAVSMRRLAGELGVTPMALYHHVPDKPALMSALVDRVWDIIFVATPPPGPDPVDNAVQACVTIRNVWMSFFDLASLAVAVSEPDDTFFMVTRGMTAIFEAIGFADVPQAYNAVQNFTMGYVEIAANRKAASAYFGRDPAATRTKAKRLMTRRGATENHRGVVEARFDEGDDAHFEASLRALIAGLLLDGSPQ